MRYTALLSLAVLLATGTGNTHAAAPRIERIAQAIPPAERRELESLDALSQTSLEQISAATAPAPLAARTRQILALDNLSIGSRATDSGGEAAIHRYLRDEFTRLAPLGLQYLGALRGETGAPVSVDHLDTAAAKPSSISVGGISWPVTPLWPNGAMPSLTPAGGLTGRLVSVRDAEWADLNGLDLNGSIALMNFQGGRNWDRLFSLGCKAVIVVEDDHVLRQRAERLFCNTPVPFPRFYVDQKTGAALLSHAATPAGQPGETCTLQGGNVYEQCPFESLFAYLPPTAPVRHQIAPNELIGRIASDFGVSVEAILEANKLASGELKPGDRIAIPDSDQTYVVKSGDLLARLAAEYGIDQREIAAANHLADLDLKPGQVVTIPNFADSLFVLTPIDSVSVAPDAPHGATVAANIAAALIMLEDIAHSPGAHRRKGIVFGFLDGDSLGGAGSRLFAENLLMADGKFQTNPAEDAATRIANYEAADAWFTAHLPPGAGPHAAISDPAARWLAESWLSVHVEKARVTAAEERIDVINQLRAAAPGPAAAALAARQAEIERRIARIAAFRGSTLENGSAPWPRRLDLFAAALGAPDSPMPFTLPGLHTQLAAELKQERARQANHDNNLRVARAIRAKVRLDGAREKPALAWYLDLSDGSATTGIKVGGTPDFRLGPAISPDQADQLSARFRDVLAFASSRANWPEPFPFFAPEDASELPMQSTEATPVYEEFWSVANLAVVPIGTLNDQLTRLDTPHDTPGFTNFGNLGVQARNLLLIVKLGLENHLDSLPPPELAKHAFGRLTGKTVRFNVRSGIDPQEPVPGASVYYPAIALTGNSPAYNTSTFRGVRKGILTESLLNGGFQFPIEELSWNTTQMNGVYAFHLDRQSALFDQIADSGQVGTETQTPEFSLTDGEEAVKKIVVTQVYPLVFFLGADPMDYAAIGEAGQYVRITDALLNGEPQHYAVVSPLKDYDEADVSADTLYMPPGRRARIMVQQNIMFVVLLTGPITPEAPKGEGYPVGPGPDGARNLSLPFTPLLIARDMQAQAGQRERIYSRYGVRDQSMHLSLERSQGKLDQAVAALAQKQWQLAFGSAREAWGMLIKCYPRVLTLGRDAVFSAILLMALMVPGCVFLEKLVIGARTIVGHLAGAAGIFILATLFLRFFHPAFLISVSPFIVLIAFTMILMSTIVLLICYQRFEVLLRRVRSASGETDDGGISFMTSLGTAFSLGVSNLKKRMSRTVLTGFTVAVLTFSIVAFVSVRGTDAVSFRPLQLERDIEGEPVDPLPPRYRGMLFREFYWEALSDQMISALRTDFGSKFEVTTRGQYLEVEGGSGADREGVNQIPIRFGARTTILAGIMTFEPNEVDFSGLNSAVTGQAWFRGRDPATGAEPDRFALILPDTAAAALGITPAMLRDAAGRELPDAMLPRVTMANQTWHVIGILDVRQANRIRDLSGKSLAMVDYQQSAFNKNVSGDLANENESYHMSWDKLAIVPAAAAQDVNATPRAFAVRFTGQTDEKRLYEDIALRLNRAFFGSVGNQIGLITTQNQTSLAGLAKIVVPVILCILIVTNTMMGAVDERKGEVSMLGSIGLSPGQISFLLLSESTVLSVIGVVAGTFCGLAFANIVPWIAAHHHGFLGSLSFNFTSLASMALAMATGAVVLLATLIPARKAAALAAPSGMARWQLPAPSAGGTIDFHLPFTLTRGNAVGMAAFFRRFLLNHNEATSADFNCRNILPRILEEPEPALLLGCAMWLAPYDLDVSQEFEMKMVPTENAGVFSVLITLRRTSGTEEAWLRTNYGFLDLVRRQFLLWRHLEVEARSEYVQKGAALFKGDSPAPLPAAAPGAAP